MLKTFISCFPSEILSLVESVTNTPEQWLPENIATLLFFAGNEITFKLLQMKMTSKFKRLFPYYNLFLFSPSLLFACSF